MIIGIPKEIKNNENRVGANPAAVRELVKNGHALSYIDSPYKKEEKEAKANKLGLWSGKFMHPRLFRRLKESQKN